MNKSGFLLLLITAILSGCSGGSGADGGSSGITATSSSVVAASRSSGNYVLAFDTIAAQGGEMNSTAYRLRGVAGQASPVGTMSSNSYVLYSGFDPQRR